MFLMFHTAWPACCKRMLSEWACLIIARNTILNNAPLLRVMHVYLTLHAPLVGLINVPLGRSGLSISVLIMDELSLVDWYSLPVYYWARIYKVVIASFISKDNPFLLKGDLKWFIFAQIWEIRWHNMPYHMVWRIWLTDDLHYGHFFSNVKFAAEIG